MVTSAQEVCTYIEQHLPGVGAEDPLKLYKLAYYAQAWHLVWEGRPLFSDRIEAWKHGPVPATCYKERSVGIIAPSANLTENQRSTIDAILRFYGKLSGWKLRELTHREDPWRDARGDLPENAHSSEEITISSMRRFYTRQAMLGKDVPRKATEHKPMSRDRALTLAAREAEKWQGTLARLAAR